MGLSYGPTVGETHKRENENKKKTLFDIYAGLFGQNAKEIPMDTNDTLPFDAQCLFYRSLFHIYRSLLT